MLLSIPVAGMVVFCAVYASGKPAAQDKTKVENALIIKDLTMDLDEAPAEERAGSGYAADISQGVIIYDDSFDSGSDAGLLDKDRAQILESLKKKDPRWHLVKYRIKKNDNLWNIAGKFGVHHAIIISLNSISDPDSLSAGRYIDIPSRAGVYHQVKKGECISKIAKEYGADASKIIAQNSLREKSVRAGKKIFIPDVNVKKPSAPRIMESRPVAGNDRIRLFWPLRGAITSGFGTRTDPFSGRRSFHCGVDIGTAVDTPVKAAANGTVIFSGWKDGYGNCIIVRHENGYITVYAHNHRNTVTENTSVQKGAVIAYSGNTGATTGAHLHFELRKYLTPLNPVRFIR